MKTLANFLLLASRLHCDGGAWPHESRFLVAMSTPAPPPPWSAARHFACAFAGRGAFEARASRFLAEGISRGERLLYVAADPRPEHWPSSLFTSGRLQLASVAETYGADGLIDAAVQREIFGQVLAAALADGFHGIRVAADNTALVRDPARLESWNRWEAVADEFMSENPVTGLCAFNREELDPPLIAALTAGHGTKSPMDSYRLMSGGP